MEVVSPSAFNGGVEEPKKPAASYADANGNVQAFEANAKASNSGPNLTDMSMNGNSSLDHVFDADLIKSSTDPTSNGVSAAILKTNGVSSITSVHHIDNGQIDGSFDTTMMDSSQPNGLAPASSAPSPSSLMEAPTQQPSSHGHAENDFATAEQTVNIPPLSRAASRLEDEAAAAKNHLGGSPETQRSPEPTDELMDASGLLKDASSTLETPLMHTHESEARPDTKVTLPSLELPHHPIAPLSTETTSENLVEEASFRHEAAPTNDHVMLDASRSPWKVAREREDEAEEGPVAKRSRTEPDRSPAKEFKVPEVPQSSMQQSVPLASTFAGNLSLDIVVVETPSGQDLSQPITKAQQKALLRAVQSVKRTKDAGAFNQPVDPVALNIPSYPDIIKRPMDLSTIETNLKDDAYSSAVACIKDFEQVVQNSITFNGIDHAVSQAALRVKTSFEKHLTNLPVLDTVDPVPPEKKSKKATTAPKIAPPRRESRSSLGGNARSPTNTASQQTFALGPQGVPLIRRDSTAHDGRPKREIHPPAPRDLPYANQKPKKKKYQTELKFCQEVLLELKKAKYQSVSWPFAQPVDPVALNIPHYHNVIKKPMDLSTIDKKLAAGQYENAKEFEADVRLMFNNCYKFNPNGNAVHRLGKDFEEIFTEKWAEKKQYLEDHANRSGPQTPGTSPEPQDDEEDEEEEPEDEIIALKEQIAAMSKQVELIRKKKGSPPVSSKKPNKGGKPSKKESKKAATAAIIKSEKKPTSKPAKKEKIPYVTYEQKQDISNRINNLPAPRMATALTIIRDNMPNLKGVQEDEIELDIDELSNEVLYKLLGFVRKYAPRPNDSPPARQVPGPAPVQASHPKKNKPMSKNEQEAKIREIQSRLSGFQNAGSDQSPEPETKDKNDTSGDEEDSEESEED